jgi:hypothetical protein
MVDYHTPRLWIFCPLRLALLPDIPKLPRLLYNLTHTARTLIHSLRHISRYTYTLLEPSRAELRRLPYLRGLKSLIVSSTPVHASLGSLSR